MVENPDATFSNDLENIVAGLTDSFVKKYGLKLIATNNRFEIPGYVLASDKKFYKYNHEINNKYYCENNIIIDGDRQVHQYDKNKYLILDYFVLDLEKNEIALIDKSIKDSFIDGLKDIQKIQISKENDNKIIEIKPKSGENIYLTIDKNNRIIEYKNNNLQQVGNCVLQYNNTLTQFEAPNLKKVGDYFLCRNQALSQFEAQNLQQVGNYVLQYNNTLTQFEAQNLQQVGDGFLFYNKGLKKFEAPNLKKVGNGFLNCNKNKKNILLSNNNVNNI